MNKIIKQIKNVRKPAVAGQFYEKAKNLLQEQLQEFLSKAKINNFENIKAIIVPHAGYVFSGQVAANAFANLKSDDIRTVLLISSAHSEYFEGLAIDGNDYWETPLGKVKVSRDLRKILTKNNNIPVNSHLHLNDHTLEVQIPFLQACLKKDFEILPIMFGQNDGLYKDFASVIEENKNKIDLIVVSSDMSHYPSYEDANKMDKASLKYIAGLDVNGLDAHVRKGLLEGIKNLETLMCGIDGIKTILQIANSSGWEASVVDYKNSGDSSYGSKDGVVGYGAVVFSKPSPKHKKKNKKKFKKSFFPKSGVIGRQKKVFSKLNDIQKRILLDIARSTVESYITKGEKPIFNIEDERLGWEEGAFVTLKVDERLRGCIGQIVSTGEPLWGVVQDMAIEASIHDPRFNPVSKIDLNKLKYEISVLSSPKKIDNWEDIDLGRHGVIVSERYNSGVFLPQVAQETGWSLEEFLSHLCVDKAGLPADAYKKDAKLKIEVFEAQVFGD